MVMVVMVVLYGKPFEQILALEMERILDSRLTHGAMVWHLLKDTIHFSV